MQWNISVPALFPYLNNLHDSPLIHLFVSSFIHSAEIYGTGLCSRCWRTQIPGPLPRANARASRRAGRDRNTALGKHAGKSTKPCWGHREGFPEEMTFEEEELSPGGDQLTDRNSLREGLGVWSNRLCARLVILRGKDSLLPHLQHFKEFGHFPGGSNMFSWRRLKIKLILEVTADGHC